MCATCTYMYRYVMDLNGNNDNIFNNIRYGDLRLMNNCLNVTFYTRESDSLYIEHSQ